MKAMRAVELRQHSESELKQNLKELKEKILGLRFQQILGQLEDTSQIRIIKHDIARIETVLREKTKQAKSSSSNQD